MTTATKVKQKPAKPAVKRVAKPVSKSAAKPAPKPVAKAAKPAQKPARPKAAKLERDTFRMTRDEFDALRKLKSRAKSLGVPARKSEILRAGLRTLHRMDDEHFAVLLAQVQSA